LGVRGWLRVEASTGVVGVAVLGGWLQGDLKAEDFELVDEGSDLAAGVDLGGVVVGAEIVEAGRGIGQQVPDDDHDGSGDGDQCFELAAAFDDAAVAFGCVCRRAM
jgi:hypothetical protein